MAKIKEINITVASNSLYSLIICQKQNPQGISNAVEGEICINLFLEFYTLPHGSTEPSGTAYIITKHNNKSHNKTQWTVKSGVLKPSN